MLNTLNFTMDLIIFSMIVWFITITIRRDIVDFFIRVLDV